MHARQNEDEDVKQVKPLQRNDMHFALHTAAHIAGHVSPGLEIFGHVALHFVKTWSKARASPPPILPRHRASQLVPSDACGAGLEACGGCGWRHSPLAPPPARAACGGTSHTRRWSYNPRCWVVWTGQHAIGSRLRHANVDDLALLMCAEVELEHQQQQGDEPHQHELFLELLQRLE